MTVEAIAVSPAPAGPNASAARRSRRVQSVEHAIDVLDVLADAPQGMGVSAVAQRVGLSKATVHHLLGTLESRQLVVRDATCARYRLSWGLYELGATVARGVGLTRIARHYLDRLAAQTGESVLLGLLDRDSVIYLDRGEASRDFRTVAYAGQRTALHTTASGKVLLAFSQDPNLLQRIVSRPLVRLTPATIVDPRQLRRELADVRWQGYATCRQEWDVSLSSLAVPVRDSRNDVIASLALAGPAANLDMRTLPQNLSLLRAAARLITTRLTQSSGADRIG